LFGKDGDSVREAAEPDVRHGKGKRRWATPDLLLVESWLQFWLSTLYDKDERDDLSSQQRTTLKTMLKAELEARRKA